MNGFVGAMVGGFELAGGLMTGVGAVVEATVGERAAEPFVKEQEEQGDLNPFWRETVGVAGSVTLQQPVGSISSRMICLRSALLLGVNRRVPSGARDSRTSSEEISIRGCPGIKHSIMM